MKKSLLFCALVPCLLTLLSVSFCLGADPKEQVTAISETKQAIEDSVRQEDWAAAEAAIATVETQMLELVASLNLVEDSAKYTKQISLIVEGMRKAVANKSDESYETPAEALRRQLLDLMEKIGYTKPPVFVIMEFQVKEALATNDRGDFDSLSEEMEEIVNMRDEARESAKKAGIVGSKVDAILDLAWDIAMDAKEKNQASSQKRLERMKSILESV